MRWEPKKWKLCVESRPTSSWSPVCTFQKRFKRDSTGCSIYHEMMRIETFMQFMQGLPRGRHFLISSPSPKDKTLRLLPPLLIQHYNCKRKKILWTHHAPVQLACKLINAPQDALFVGKEVVNLIFANWISIIIPPIVRVGAYLCFKVRTLRLWFGLSLKKNQLVPEFPCWLQEENQKPDLGSKSTFASSQLCKILGRFHKIVLYNQYGCCLFNDALKRETSYLWAFHDKHCAEDTQEQGLGKGKHL